MCMRDVNEQATTPLFSQMCAFTAREAARFFSPGHKGGRTLPKNLRENVAQLDLNNLPEMDTLHCPTGCIAEAEGLLAKAYSVDASFMLVGGSSGGNVAATVALVSPGERVIVQRNCHKSTIAALIHCGAVPIWVLPDYDRDFGIAHALGVEAVENAFRHHRDIKAVICLGVTYFGSAPAIKALSDVCDRAAAKLIVDAAHGAHLQFHPELPDAAERTNAAAVVQSIHKVLSGLSQAAVLHVSARHVEISRVRQALQMIQTTSPHYAILASIDIARQQMACEGHKLLTKTLALARAARRELNAIPGVQVLGPDRCTPGSGLSQLDETKLTISIRELNANGRQWQTQLSSSLGVDVELAGEDYLLCIVTIGTIEEDVYRLVEGIRRLAKESTSAGAIRASAAKKALYAHAAMLVPETGLTPREAFYAKAEMVDLDAAAGRIVADTVTPYPPGIPLLTPGEIIRQDTVDVLASMRAERISVSAADPALGTVRVVG